MQKPQNRKERIDFIAKKKGLDFAYLMYRMTDSEVKSFYVNLYPIIKDKEDFDGIKEKPICIRCGCGVEICFSTECGCGDNRSVYSEEDWKNDIESNSERLEEDYIFITNGHKLNN